MYISTHKNAYMLISINFYETILTFTMYVYSDVFFKEKKTPAVVMYKINFMIHYFVVTHHLKSTVLDS